MFDSLKKLLKAKIEINIIYPPCDGVQHYLTPKVIRKDVVEVKRKSNLRVASQTDQSIFGKHEVTYYKVQEYRNGSWYTVSDTFDSDKNKVFDKYLKLMRGECVANPQPIEMILAEGLDYDEAEVVAALHKFGS